MPKASLDRLDRQIIAALSRDGRMSYRELARSLDISEGTVRMRLSRLQDENLVKVTLVGSPLALGVGVYVMIMLRVTSGFPSVRQISSSSPCTRMWAISIISSAT